MLTTVLKSTVISFRRQFSSCGREFSLRPFQERNALMSPTTCIIRKLSFQKWPMILANSQPVQFAQETLVNVHDTLGITWSTTILVAVACLRIGVTLPLTVYQSYIIAKYENILKEMPEIAKELKLETDQAVRMYRWNEKRAKLMYQRSLRKELNRQIVEENCHPVKGLLVVLFQMPVWISLSMALRNLTSMWPPTALNGPLIYLQLSVGGLFWFSNMTVPDPTFVVPLLLGVVNLSIIELHALRKITGRRTTFQKIVTNGLRVFSIAMVFIAAHMPASISYYWLLSSIFGLGQNVLLRLPKFRRLCRIPVTPSESKTPFKDVIEGIKKKLPTRFS